MIILGIFFYLHHLVDQLAIGDDALVDFMKLNSRKSVGEHFVGYGNVGAV